MSVSATVLLSSQVRRPHADVPVLNPAIFIRDERDAEAAELERDFAVLSPLADEEQAQMGLCLVAHNSDIFHIVRPNIPSMT